VLSSTITRSKPQWKIAQSHRDGVASMALAGITMPVLVVSHKNDGCDITPASDAPKLTGKLGKARKVETVLLEGGSKPQSEPCEAKAEHGFFGIEDKAVSAIAAFVKANGS
jgi:pimeloyl-ACP methyl ester carboxylesterase